MLIQYDPDAYVATSSYEPCPFHKANPDIRDYPGCTCTASWGQRPATPEEYRKNREARLDRERRKAEWGW